MKSNPTADESALPRRWPLRATTGGESTAVTKWCAHCWGANYDAWVTKLKHPHWRPGQEVPSDDEAVYDWDEGIEP